MNAGGHIAVAAKAFATGNLHGAEHRESDPSRAARLLGAALPDLATIGRFRLLGTTAHRSVAHGIDLHHRTDDLFHRHPWFRDRNRELTAHLAESGLARGPSMACSHVGIELILDGRLLAETDNATANEDAFDAIVDVRDELAPLVSEDKRDRWMMHLDRLAEHRLPTDYHDPEAVAARLHRILAARPRLALDQKYVAIVAEALADRKDDIDNTALDLVVELADELGSQDGPPRQSG